MKTVLLRMAAVAVVLGCVTCECDDCLTVLTFNTGLAPAVPGYDTRITNVIDALGNASSAVDFMCLQEVWFENDMQRILDKVKSTMPHHYSDIHYDLDILQEGHDCDPEPCLLEEVEAMTSCVQANCSSMPPNNEKTCIMTNCHDQVYDMRQTCRTCISVAGSGDEVMAKCLNGTNRFNKPGLLVISKQPMSDVTYEKYHDSRKMLIQRGYIQARIENLTFVCTHLTSVFPDFFDEIMNDLYQNYEEMQRAEINKLWTAFSSINHVLMGDLNTGPVRNDSGHPYIKGEVKENYELLVSDDHYSNPYMQDLGLCTYCNSDNNATWEEHKGDAIVDHVLLSKDVHPVSTCSKRVFTHDKGQMSDHYGVQLSICLNQSQTVPTV